MKAQTWCNTNKNEGSIQQMALFSSFSKKLFKIPNCTLDSKTFFPTNLVAIQLFFSTKNVTALHLSAVLVTNT